MANDTILILLILIPFVAGFFCWQLESVSVAVVRWLALASMVLLLVLSGWLWSKGGFSFVPGASPWVLEYHVAWIPRLGVSLHFGMDGLSLLMVALTALLGVFSVSCSWKEIDTHVGFFHMNLLWILGGVIGVFLALDLFLFFFFWEMMLVPMFFLIALWGHSGATGLSRIATAIKFFIFTQFSGLVMLVAILAFVLVHYRSTGTLSFDYEVLRGTVMDGRTEYLLMLGFFLAFSVKLPVVPVHSWLPDAHSQAPTAGSVILAGILLKTAGYGFLRFCLPLFPNASAEFAPIAMWLGVISIFYAAVLAFSQSDIKRLVAYTSISHMGFVLVGIYSHSYIALQGVVVQMVAHGLSAAGLFMLSGQLYERLHTREFSAMGGLWGRMKGLPPIALVFVAASLGMPALGNFIGEFLILLGTFQEAPKIAVISAVGVVLAAAYSLVILQRAFHGPAKSDEPIRDSDWRELATLLSIVVLMVWLGLFPQAVLDASEGPMKRVHEWYSSTHTLERAVIRP
jgi:NADH-quinone oxidoreductase subunit M